MKSKSLFACIVALAAVSVTACMRVSEGQSTEETLTADTETYGVGAFVRIWTDPKTGCDYIVATRSSYGVSIMPRLDASNHMVCKAAAEPFLRNPPGSNKAVQQLSINPQ